MQRTKLESVDPHPLPLRGPIVVPDDVLSLVFSSLTLTLPDEPNGWHIRNATLRASALVSKDWRLAANRELYGALRLEWAARRAGSLLQAFENNPNLHAGVRKVTAEWLDFDTWNVRWWWWGPGAEEEVVRIRKERWPSNWARNRESVKFAEESRAAGIVSTGGLEWLSDRNPDAAAAKAA